MSVPSDNTINPVLFLGFCIRVGEIETPKVWKTSKIQNTHKNRQHSENNIFVKNLCQEKIEGFTKAYETLRPTSGCRLGQSDCIAMKLKLDVSCNLPKLIYTYQLSKQNLKILTKKRNDL